MIFFFKVLDEDERRMRQEEEDKGEGRCGREDEVWSMDKVVEEGIAMVVKRWLVVIRVRKRGFGFWKGEREKEI